MFNLYNTDTRRNKKLRFCQFVNLLFQLQDEGAFFSLDLEGQATYSFRNNNETETIQTIIQETKIN